MDQRQGPQRHGTIFRDFVLDIFYQIFLSPQVKRTVFISNKNGIYELLHKFPNASRLGMLGNNEMSG